METYPQTVRSATAVTGDQLRLMTVSQAAFQAESARETKVTRWVAGVLKSCDIQRDGHKAMEKYDFYKEEER